MADLLIRGVDEALVQALKKRAGAHGRSQAAELRAILSAALLSPPRCNLADWPSWKARFKLLVPPSEKANLGLDEWEAVVA
jgi:hypothetical protein